MGRLNFKVGGLVVLPVLLVAHQGWMREEALGVPRLPVAQTVTPLRPSQSATPQPAQSPSPQTSKAIDKETIDPKLLTALSMLGATMLLYLAVLWCRPQWLLLVPAEFKIPRTEIKLPLAVVLWLKYRPRVLDAWVASRIDAVQVAFEQRATVKERQIHISMPVSLDGQAIANLTAKDLQAMAAKRQFRLLICGEGGVGKTSLACQVAKWAMAGTKGDRLCAHRMIPVLIEEEMEGTLLEAITRQLRNLRDEEKPISEELLKQFLEQRRLLVIVDHLSEMGEATRKATRLRDASSPVNALVVTSRLEDILGREVTQTILQPEHFDRNQLLSFMKHYLTARNEYGLFTDEWEYIEDFKRLKLITDTREVTALFAKLYLELMIDKAKGKINDLPENVPNLMLSYLNWLNREKAGRFENQIVQRDAKVVAWQCLRSAFKPELTDRQETIKVLAEPEEEEKSAQNIAEEHLNYLEKRLSLITADTTETKIRFILDPLAEYLAGLHIVEQYREDETQWQAFLLDAREKPGTLEEIRGFLLAVRDSCLARADLKVPATVVEELANLAGLDLELLEQERRVRRVRRLISELSVPEPGDRKRAAQEIGKIGSTASIAIPALMKALQQDEDKDVCWNATLALVKLKVTSDDVVNELLTALEGKNEEIRLSAAEELGKLGVASDMVVNKLLIAFTEDKSGFVRLNAAEALGKLGVASDAVVNELLIALTGEDYIRSSAVKALGDLGVASDKVVNELFTVLTEYEYARSSAAEVLVKLGPSDAVVNGLLVVLKDEDEEVRWTATEALGKLRAASDAVVNGLLLTIFTDEDEYVRSSAARALGKLGYLADSDKS